MMGHDERRRSPLSTSDATCGKTNILFLSLHGRLNAVTCMNAIGILSMEDRCKTEQLCHMKDDKRVRQIELKATTEKVTIRETTHEPDDLLLGNH